MRNNIMVRRTLSTREAYGSQERISGLEVSYPLEVRALLRTQLREQRRLAEARAKRLIWADERAAQARSISMGRMGVRRPDGEERSTRGVVLEKPEVEGQDILVGWVDAEYRNTKTEIRKNRYEQQSRRTIHGGTKFASVTIGRAHQERRSKKDVTIAVPGHGLLWVTPEEVISTGDKDVKRAFAGMDLTDQAYAEAKRRLDRLDGALTLIRESMRDDGLNPEIAPYLGTGGDTPPTQPSSAAA